MIFVLLTGLLLPDDRSHGDHDNGTTEAANSSASGSATVPAGHAPVHSQPGPRRGAFVAWHGMTTGRSAVGTDDVAEAVRRVMKILKLLIYPYPKNTSI